MFGERRVSERAVLKKLSAIIIEMAETVLARPGNMVCDEAAHVALLLAHVAWNREIQAHGLPTRKQYEALLKEFAKSNREFVKDLRGHDFDALIAELRLYKRRRYPKDTRFISVCGTTPTGNVHVEWTESDDRTRVSTRSAEKTRAVDPGRSVNRG